MASCLLQQDAGHSCRHNSLSAFRCSSAATSRHIVCSRSLTASLMMHGRNNGKKIKAVEIVRNSCEIIHLLTDSNPIQVIVDAVINRWAAPCTAW